MEGCPRALMLKLDLKESHLTSFAPALKRYIREFYQEDGEAYNQECSQLEQLRTAVIKPTYDNSGCNLLWRYYGQIHLLKTRFPMGEGSAVSVEFTWTDLYTEDPITISDIAYEQTSILFNLGSLHSLLGSREDRVSEEGMKVACTHYQSAAGAFTYIKENFSTDQYSDTSKDLLNLYTNVMLGQAQECLLEKSMLDNRKNSLVARIAMQVQNYYTEAIACLTSSFGEILPPRMHKQWSKTLQIKCAYLNALAYMYMGNASDEQGKYGEKVAFMKIASQKVNEAQKLLKNQGQQMQEVVQFITDVIAQKLESAKRDNDFIYHETEPASTALPEIKGASLVKPIPFQPYDPSMGKDIFEKLIPMQAHESSSLYSEEKANLLRRYASIVGEKDKELSSWLASMHIDDLIRPEEADDLPADLTTKCESLQSNPGAIKKSIEMLTKLKEKGVELEKTLDETRKEITDVQNEKKTFMEKYGVKLEDDKLKEFFDEVNSYQQKHVDAKKTNDELEKAFESHRHNLELLIGPEQALHGILPSQNILDSPIEDDAVQRIRDLLAKIEKMKTQRAQFMDKLREQVNKDDITHLIATRDGSDLESLFKEEIKKHDESCELLQCNLDAQEKIMKALTEANAKYAHARRSVAEIKAKRDLVVRSLIGSYDFFMSFKDKVSSGVTFYNQLSEIFEKRRQEMAAICKSEKERLKKIVEKAKQIKEERERKSESKVDPTVSSNIPPERRNNPGNPQQPPIIPAGYQPQPGHVLQLPGTPLSHQAIPHSLRGPAPTQPPPIQSGHPGQFTPVNLPPRGQSNQPGMSQYIPRIPPASLLTARPRMSYPHPPFTTTSPEGPRPPTSMSWQPPPGSRPGDTPSNIRFPPPLGIRPPNIPLHSSIPQQYPGRPQLPMHTPQGQGYQVGNDRSNWQPRGPQQYGKGPQFGTGGPDQNAPPRPQIIPQRSVLPQRPILSHQPIPTGQPSFQQRPPSQLIQPVQQQFPQQPQHLPQQSQHLPQQPPRPETPPSPQRIQPAYKPKPPSYQQQFGIGSNQPGTLQQPGPQHMQPVPQPFQNPPPHGQQSHGQRPVLYQQPGQQPMLNQQSRSHQIPTQYQQQPQPSPRMPPPSQHPLPSGHHQVPQQQQLPQQLIRQPPPQQIAPQQHPGALPPQQQVAVPRQPSGPYHQLGPYQQRFPYQPHQQVVGSHHQQIPHQLGYQDQRGSPSPSTQEQGPAQHGPQIPPGQKQHPQYQIPPSQVPHNFPPALEPQSYQKQPLAQKFSSENLPSQQQRGPFQLSQPRETPINPQEPSAYGKSLQPSPQEKLPYQTSQHDRPANPAPQLLYGGHLQPKPTEKAHQNLTEDKHGHFQQPYYNQASEYPSQLQAQSNQQDTSQTGGPNKASYMNQPWQQQQQYKPTLPQHHSSSQYPQTSKTVVDPNDLKPGAYPSTSTPSSHGVTSTYPPPTSSQNFTQTQQENLSSQKGDLPSKPGMHASSTPSSQGIPHTRPGVTSTFPHSTSGHNFTQTQQGDLPSNPGMYPSSTPSSQGIPHTRPSVTSTFPHSTTSHHFTHTQQENRPPKPQNPSLDTRSPYFPAHSTQAPQPYPKENQPNVNVAKPPVSSSGLNFRSKSFQDFNPKKVVLAKPGALSVSPLPVISPATATEQDLTNPSTTGTQSMDSSNVNHGVVGRSEVSHIDSSLYSHTDLTSRTSGMNLTNPAHLGTVKPKSTIDDKLLENLKSLDFPQPLAPKQPGKLTEVLGPNAPELGTNAPGSNIPGPPESSTPGLNTPGIGTSNINTQGSDAHSSQENVHKLQQKVLLQQQQLIEQQQRFLEQQTQGEHSQVWRLMEQIKQQQKELEELRSEMKVKDQFGEIERHLENLERKQIEAESRKTEEVKSDEQEVLGNTKEQTEPGEGSDSIVVAEGMDEKNKESKKTLVEIGENLPEKTTHDELSEITAGGESNVQGTKEDFLMSQLSQFSLSSAQHNIASTLTPTTSMSVNEHEVKPETILDDAPPKPLRAPQENPTTTEKPEMFPIFPSFQSKTGIPILSEESKMMPLTGVTEPAKDVSPQAPPPKPIKQRPPPPTPVVDPPTRPGVSLVTRDVFTKPTPDLNKQGERSDECDYVSRLAGEVEVYREVVNDLSKRQARGPSILTKEWLAVQHYQDTVSQVLTSDVGKMNTTKNRYLDILPYDQTRVILENKEDSDYINATMIEDLTPLSPKYIASQGPIPQCFMDFWLMVWQQRCPLIVMLTKEVEGKKLKCHQYWPKDEGHSMLFGSLRVTMKRQTSLAFWKERLIHITHNETHELHVVEHYQFTGWPDHGVPSNPSDFFTFMGHIYIRHQTVDPDVKRPILLHCSAGVGRTGAFIVIYSAMREMYSGNGIIDVQKLVKKLREKRKYMVQKKEQYDFCYKGILYSAEQFLIIENHGNTAEEDSSDSMSSSDTCSYSSDDEAEHVVKPAIPERPRISQKPREILGSGSEPKGTGKKNDSDNLDSEHAPQGQEQPKSDSEKCVSNNDSTSQKREVISENSDDISQKCDQNSKKVQNVEENFVKAEPGNTLNNLQEICTKSLPDNDNSPETRSEDVNEGGIDPGRFQDTNNTKISMAESSEKESSSSKGSNMGETKYKEITEEPEEEVADSGSTDCENAGCGTAVSENAAVIPGLQEIQEGLIKDDDDVINEGKNDVGLKDDINHEENNSGEIFAGNVEIIATESTSSAEKVNINLKDGLVECGDTPHDTEISSGTESDMILPQENVLADIPQIDTDARKEDGEVRQESTSTDKDMPSETDNQ